MIRNTIVMEREISKIEIEREQIEKIKSIIKRKDMID